MVIIFIYKNQRLETSITLLKSKAQEFRSKSENSKKKKKGSKPQNLTRSADQIETHVEKLEKLLRVSQYDQTFFDENVKKRYIKIQRKQDLLL